MVGSGGAWLLPVPRGANQLPATGRVPLSRDGPLASHAAAAQPERLVPVGPHGTAGGSVPAPSAHSSSVAQQALCRQTPQVGARCANRARRDLCGGRPVTGVPTAIIRLIVLMLNLEYRG